MKKIVKVVNYHSGRRSDILFVLRISDDSSVFIRFFDMNIQTPEFRVLILLLII
jgi:hypothetical protein